MEGQGSLTSRGRKGNSKKKIRTLHVATFGLAAPPPQSVSSRALCDLGYVAVKEGLGELLNKDKETWTTSLPQDRV